jgi:hypothetical protein
MATVVGPSSDLTPLLVEDGLAYVVSGADRRWDEDPVFREREVRGVVIDAEPSRATPVIGVILRTEQSWVEVGFLAGVVTGWIGDGRAAGFVATDGDLPQDRSLAAGFSQGLRYACPRCLQVDQGTSSLDAADLVRRGVQAVFISPGPQAAESARQAVEAGLWFVWAGAGLPDDLTSRMAARIQNGPEALLGAALDSLAAGDDGQKWPYSVRSGSLDVVGVLPEAISPGKQRLLMEAFEKLASGELLLVAP